MRYRKKPIEVEARQLHLNNAQDMADWCQGLVAWGPYGTDNIENIAGVSIVTLAGTLMANVGDWVICGVQGEFYPCKPDIFAATYEPVSEPNLHPPRTLSESGDE